MSQLPGIRRICCAPSPLQWSWICWPQDHHGPPWIAHISEKPMFWSNKFRRICESLVNHLQIMCQSLYSHFSSIYLHTNGSRHWFPHQGTRTFFADSIASQLLLPPEPGLVRGEQCSKPSKVSLRCTRSRRKKNTTEVYKHHTLSVT